MKTALLAPIPAAIIRSSCAVRRASVEAKLQSDERSFTPRIHRHVDMNATADFGINFAKGQIFGFCSTTQAPA